MGISVLTLGQVKYIEESNTYEVYFRFDPYDPATKETWGVNMQTGDVWPIDLGALSSGTYLYCAGKDDQSAKCRSHLLMWERTKTKLASGDH